VQGTGEQGAPRLGSTVPRNGTHMPMSGRRHGWLRRLPDGLPPFEDAVSHFGGYGPRPESEMVSQLVLEELRNLLAPVAAQQSRDQRVTETVVLINGSGVVGSLVGTKDADGIPLVQHHTQVVLRSPSPLRIVLHAVRVQKNRPLMPRSVRGSADERAP
jgi:hypothetical protein